MLEKFSKYESAAMKEAQIRVKEREELERKRQARIAKEKAEEMARNKEPKIQELTDAEAEELQKQLDKVMLVQVIFRLVRGCHDTFCTPRFSL